MQGAAIVISNHTSSVDPVLILAGCNRLLSFLVSREHFKLHPVTHWALCYSGCVPVTRSGQDPTGLLRALRRLAQGGIVSLFPEGNLSGVSLNRLRPGKPGMALLALHSRVPVYPVFISGGPRTERLLNSWLFPSAKAVRVIFGKPVDLSDYYDQPRTRRVIHAVTCLLMEKIGELDPKRHKRGSCLTLADTHR